MKHILISFLLLFSIYVNAQGVQDTSLLCATIPLNASDLAIDSIPIQNHIKPCYSDCYKFDLAHIAAPACIIGLASITAIDHTNGINAEVDSWFGSHKPSHAEDVLRFVPSAAYMTIGFIPGVEAHHSFRDRLMVATTAHLAMLGMGYGLKHVVSETRPDMSADDSFPSGHAALAFTGAELLRIEYGNIYGLGGYITAGAVSYLRLRSHQHWFGDVLMGAGIGMLSARIGYWLLPYEQQLFGSKSTDRQSVAALPSFDPATRSIGIGLVAVF